MADDYLAGHFEAHRPRLTAAARRMLGSEQEAEDAVQEAWLRLSGADAYAVDDLPAWLTTVVARICLNQLRSRRRHGEEPIDSTAPLRDPRPDPSQEVELADSVGVALLVVLDALNPLERLAFILHDMFDLPFEQIAPIVDRSPTATRQLASRARRRIRGAAAPDRDPVRHRQVVDAYLAAARNGDFAALVRLLHPDVVLRADAHASPAGTPALRRGARAVAEGAVASAARARHASTALIDGEIGIAMTVAGEHRVLVRFTITDQGIEEIDVTADPARMLAIDVDPLA